MVAECPFPDDMVQAPRTNLHSMFVANLQERAKAGLQLAGGAGESAFRLELLASVAHHLLPQLAEVGELLGGESA